MGVWDFLNPKSGAKKKKTVFFLVEAKATPKSQLSKWRKPSCLRVCICIYIYTGDEILHSYIAIMINYKDPVIKQPGWLMESTGPRVRWEKTAIIDLMSLDDGSTGDMGGFNVDDWKKNDGFPYV